jgi:hypothetical protein
VVDSRLKRIDTVASDGIKMVRTSIHKSRLNK